MDTTDEAGASPSADDERWDALESQLGYTFHDRSRLERAMTHSSSTADKSRDNERLEFFGDAVLAMIVCEHLYHTYPGEREGDLTEVKSQLVRRETLAAATRDMDLRPYLILGRGIGRRQRLPDSVYANVFEALVAAFYLDGGYAVARDFVLRHLGPVFDVAHAEANRGNHKSLLQEIAQRDYGTMPEYRVTAERGPDHSKTFEIAVYINGEERGRGRGGSKKEGEQAAAHAALKALPAGPPPATAPDACPDSADPDSAHPPSAAAPGS